MTPEENLRDTTLEWKQEEHNRDDEHQILRLRFYLDFGEEGLSLW